MEGIKLTPCILKLEVWTTYITNCITNITISGRREIKSKFKNFLLFNKESFCTNIFKTSLWTDRKRKLKVYLSFKKVSGFLEHENYSSRIPSENECYKRK